MDAIFEMSESRERVMVTSFLAQRHGEGMAALQRGVDSVAGFEHYSDIPLMLWHELCGASVALRSMTVPFRDEGRRFRLVPDTVCICVCARAGIIDAPFVFFRIRAVGCVRGNDA